MRWAHIDLGDPVRDGPFGRDGRCTGSFCHVSDPGTFLTRNIWNCVQHCMFVCVGFSVGLLATLARNVIADDAHRRPATSAAAKL